MRLITCITCQKCGKCVVRAKQAKYCLECAAQLNREQTLSRYYANREHRLAVQQRYRERTRQKKKAPKG